jgi:hypothetical protein
MDFIQVRKYKEWLLFGLVGIATVFALLPPQVAEQLSINRQYVAAILGIVLVIALFMALKFALFIMVALLVVGINGTDNWSEALGISKVPMVIALMAMVGISLINHVVSILPTGLEAKPREKSLEGVKAMFYAIEKDNLVYAQKVLSMDFDPNLLNDNGYTPLQYAAMRGNPQMVELFLRNGASVDAMSKEGENAVELALKMGHTEAAEVLKKARQEAIAKAEAEKAGAKK